MMSVAMRWDYQHRECPVGASLRGKKGYKNHQQNLVDSSSFYSFTTQDQIFPYHPLKLKRIHTVQLFSTITQTPR